MSTEERRVFPLETALQVVANKGSSEAIDFLSYAVQQEVSDFAMPAVAPMVKGWLFSLEPKFMKAAYPPAEGYDGWVAEHKKNIGDNISLEPMSEGEREGLTGLLTKIQDLQAELAGKVEELEETTAKFEEAEPFVAKSEKLEAAEAKLKEENEALKKEVAELKAQTAEFQGKIAINEADIESSVKDMVSKAVKEALASLPSGGEGFALDEVVEEKEADQGPAADFGFGTSGSDSDGFGF